MTCQGNDERLGDYVDGTLDGAGRAAFEAHLAGCARCGALAADFQAIRLAAHTLDVALPPAGAWPRIAAAIDAQAPRRWWRFGAQTVWQPAAAVAMAVVLTTGLSWLGGRLRPEADGPRLASAATLAPAVVDTALENADLATAARDYAREIAGLERIAADERHALDPVTADVLQVNLTVIDLAIGESRAALDTEPDSDLAVASLFEALRRKLALLQDAVALIDDVGGASAEG